MKKKCCISSLVCQLESVNVHTCALSQTQSRQEDAAANVGRKRLPSTAITAGMVHNIHRISIIGHLKSPDIQIKYLPKAIDSKVREGTDGPLPPVERSQTGEKTNSNLNQVWAIPKKPQTEGSTEHHSTTATHLSATSIQPASN